jgi:hypothetical protein
MRRLVTIVLCTLAACGEPTAGTDAGAASDAGHDAGAPSTLSGALGFDVVDSFTYLQDRADGGLDHALVEVLGTSVASSSCQTLEQRGLVSGWAFGVAVGAGTDGGQVRPGAYVIGGNPTSPQGGAAVLLARLGADAGVELSLQASSGTITFITVDDTGAQGSFEAQLALGDGGSSALTGTFSAPTCR